MATTWTWAQIIGNIEGITTKTTGNSSQTTTNKWGIDTSNGAWLYIPTNGYYTTSHWLNIPWNTLKAKLGNAGTSHVLTGIKFSSSNGINITGSMSNRGAVTHTFTPSGSEQTYTIQGGYHNGNGYVKCKAVSLSGNADAGHVLSGYTFYKNSLTKQTGTMANRGALNWKPGTGTTYTVSAGYYSGGTLDSRDAYNKGKEDGKNSAQSKIYNVYMERIDNENFSGRLHHIPNYQSLTIQDVNFCFPGSWDLNDTTNGVRQLTYSIFNGFLNINSSGNTFNNATNNTFNVVIKPKYRFDVWATASSTAMIVATVNGIESAEDVNPENWGFYWHQQRIVEGGAANTRGFGQKITWIDKSAKTVRIEGGGMKTGENYHLIIFSRY